MRQRWIAAISAGALASTAAGGFFTAQAVLAQESQKTETITIENGEPGPAGPPGPKGEKGDPGGVTCPQGFVPGTLIINHPGGQTTVFTCLEE